MHNLYKFTQNDFPFPYNKSDVWKDGRSIGCAVQNASGIAYNFDVRAYKVAVKFIIEHDKGAILNALETTEHNLSQDEVNNILARHNLTKDDYAKKIKEHFNKNI